MKNLSLRSRRTKKGKSILFAFLRSPNISKTSIYFLITMYLIQKKNLSCLKAARVSPNSKCRRFCSRATSRRRSNNLPTNQIKTANIQNSSKQIKFKLKLRYSLDSPVTVTSCKNRLKKVMIKFSLSNQIISSNRQSPVCQTLLPKCSFSKKKPSRLRTKVNLKIELCLIIKSEPIY